MTEESSALPIRPVVRDRLIFCVMGAAAGLALYFLSEIWTYPGWSASTFLAIFSFVAVYSVVVLALIGPVRPGKAALGAFGIAVPSAALVTLAGQRYSVATEIFDSGPTLGLAFLMVFLSTPFVTLWLRDKSRWKDYELLFEASWSMVMRYALAWVFVGVFWALIFLSDALLDLVGIDLFQVLFDVDSLAAVLSGAVLGLGLAVVYELRRSLSLYLVLRMFRLLVPLVLAVVALFIAALPLRGLSELFGGVSSAGTLMAASLVSITLVSIAVDRDDTLMVSTRGLRLSTRVLAMLQLVLAVLALWAVALRVQQYGWTPDRVLAAMFGAILMLYGLGYSIAGALGKNWTGRVRAVNTWLALVSIVVMGAWMTPLLDANRISTNSQIARFSDGRLTADKLAYWAMQHDWGLAGRAGLARLETMSSHADFDDVQRIIDTVREQQDEYRFEQTLADQTAPEEMARLIAVMPILPKGEIVTIDELSGLPDYRRSQWLQGCNRIQSDGRAGCVLVIGSFLPIENRQGMFLFHDEQGQTRVHSLILDGADTLTRDAYDPVERSWPVLAGDVVQRVQDGDYRLQQRTGNALHIGDRVLEAIP
ncbi:MAG: hypothetical protein ACU0AZ_07200 [Paracoccaceae bacterium]